MAIIDITKPMALDETLQGTNTKMDAVIQKLQGIIDALGLDTSVYKPKGNITCAALVPALLIDDNLGNVYNVTDNGTTTSDFVEGAGKPIHVGDNVAIVDVGTGGQSEYKFDLLAGMVDLTNYVQKSATPGLLKNDGTVDTKDYAEKVSSATNGNLAGLNATGNPTDSGISGDMTTTSATGNPISIADLKSAQIALNPVITFEPIQAGSGTPSPSNIRAISGYDKIEVLSCGKNLADTSKLGSYQVTASGTMRWGLPLFLKAGTYTFSKSGGSATLYLTNVTDNYSFVEIGSAQYPYTFTINSTSYIIIRTSGNTSSDWDIVNAQVEEGSSATTYVPYHKTTDLSESLGQTVYGGSLDVRTGVLTGIWKKIVFDGSSDEPWIVVSAGTVGGYVHRLDISDSVQANDIAIIGSAFQGISFNNRSFNNIGAGWLGADKTLAIMLTDYTTAEAWKTYLASNPLEVCYMVSGEIQLTPHEIALSQGYNYISTNGTSISLAYHNGEVATHADVEQLAETLDNVIEYLGNNIAGSYVTLTVDDYVFPCDGYVVASAESDSSGVVRIVVQDKYSQNIAFLYMPIVGAYQIQSLYVKKGMKAKVIYSTMVNGWARFIPLM